VRVDLVHTGEIEALPLSDFLPTLRFFVEVTRLLFPFARCLIPARVRPLGGGSSAAGLPFPFVSHLGGLPRVRYRFLRRPRRHELSAVPRLTFFPRGFSSEPHFSAIGYFAGASETSCTFPSGRFFFPRL